MNAGMIRGTCDEQWVVLGRLLRVWPPRRIWKRGVFSGTNFYLPATVVVTNRTIAWLPELLLKVSVTEVITYS